MPANSGIRAMGQPRHGFQTTGAAHPNAKRFLFDLNVCHLVNRLLLEQNRNPKSRVVQLLWRYRSDPAIGESHIDLPEVAGRKVEVLGIVMIETRKGAKIARLVLRKQDEIAVTESGLGNSVEPTNDPGVAAVADPIDGGTIREDRGVLFAGENRSLLREVNKQEVVPRHIPPLLRVSLAVVSPYHQSVVVILAVEGAGLADLPEVGHAGRGIGAVLGGQERWQEKGQQYPDEGNHNKHLYQREPWLKERDF